MDQEVVQILVIPVCVKTMHLSIGITIEEVILLKDKGSQVQIQTM